MASNLAHRFLMTEALITTPSRTTQATANTANRPLPRWHYLAALALGALNTLSFAPTPHGGWLEIIIIALLYGWLMRTKRWKSALLTGWAFGFGNFATGVWWLYVSLHFYGGLPAPVALLALALLALLLGFFPALAAAVWSYCTQQPAQRPGQTAPVTFCHGHISTCWRALLFASAWALCEWLRGTVFTGFPWLSIGYAQVDGPLAGFAPLVGVYGTGWVLALVAAFVAQAACAIAKHHHGRALISACIAIICIAAGLALARVSWTRPVGTPLCVRLLQGNVPQDMKFDPAHILMELDALQHQITGKPADLVVTPETAVPILLAQVPPAFTSSLQQFSDTSGTSILFGAVGATLTSDGQITDYTNSLFGMKPDSSHDAAQESQASQEYFRYNKHHLVPFGEFVPWGFHWFVQMMAIPLGDFARGHAVQAPFMVRGHAVSVNICFEDLFGEEIARNIRDNPVLPTMLVNASNLGWFGNTIALDQHLQIARMRTLETGRPLLAATNTGVTAAIDARGNVQAKLRPFTVGALDASVQGMTGLTPYVQHGNTPVLALALLLLAAGFAVRLALRQKSRSIR
jgi:apolipoprotein N-acyltransferase